MGSSDCKRGGMGISRWKAKGLEREVGKVKLTVVGEEELDP